jgi:fructose-bisphosphate aldolase class I
MSTTVYVSGDASALAVGAAASQSVGLLPVVTVAMPDLATHSLAVTEAVTANALRALFAELERYDVELGTLIVRLNMVVAGERHARRTTPGEAAAATLRVLAENVPPEVAGVAFLSGGLRIGRAAANLSAIAAEARHRGLPHRLTFAFGRALAEAAVQAWQGGSGNLPVVQRELVQSCRTAAQALTPSLSGDAASA